MMNAHLLSRVALKSEKRDLDELKGQRGALSPLQGNEQDQKVVLISELGIRSE